MKRLKIHCECAQLLFEMSAQIYHNIINGDDMVMVGIKIVLSRNNI